MSKAHSYDPAILPSPPVTLALAGGLVPKIEEWVGRMSRVGDHPFFDPAQFPWTRTVEALFPVIRSELEQVLAGDVPGFEEVSKHQVKLTNDRRWKTFFFLAYGERFEDNIERCPGTWAALKMIPGLSSAFFSILEPGKILPVHRGPYKGVLRYHLGVMIPKDRNLCTMEVDHQRQTWGEGESMIFDDSFFHRALNESDERRVVLFVDFERPLPFPANIINRAIMRVIARSEYVQDVKVNYREWRRDRR